MKMITRTLAANSSHCRCCLQHQHHHRPYHMISHTQEEEQQRQRYSSLSSLSTYPSLFVVLISYLLLSLLSSSIAAQSNMGAVSVPPPPPHAAALASPGGGSSILEQFSPNCSAVSHVFQARGIDLSEVPQKPSNEMVLRYCESPTVGTCCTYNMETKMAMQSRLQLEKHSKEQILKLSNTFASKANKFNEVFRKLLLESKEEFHNMFTRTYGVIYQQNSYVFSDLFNELESYYARGRVDLIEVMDKFFNVLYQKMFQVLNAQYQFDEKYLRCVSEHMKELKPFGDVPDKLSVQIKRSFVATRTYAHALLTAAELSRKLVNVRLNADCTAALTKMQHCGACKGYAEKPCTNYCVNVIKGCLHYFNEFDVEWENFASAMDKVAERLLGSFNIVMVVEPINIKISEAIMNFQDSGQDITNRVFQGCGRPALGRVKQNPKFAAIAPQPQEQHQQFIGAGSSSGGGSSSSSNGNADSRVIMRRAAFEEPGEQIESDILDIDAALDDAIVLREKRVAEPQATHDVASVSDEPSTAPRGVGNGGNGGGGAGGGGGSGENGGRGSGGGGRRNQKRKQKKGDESEHVAYDPVLDKMVRDIRQRVKDSKKFWSNLPHQICSNDEISASSDVDGLCWNGHTIDRYMHSVTTEHGRNPEFPGNPATTRQTSQVATQLYYLKNVISHLRNAHNGQDVDWSEQEEPYYGSGSGSGGGSDDEDDDEGSGLGSPFPPSHKPDHTDHPAVHVNQNVDDEDDEDAVEERHGVDAGRAGAGADTHTTRPKYTGESGGDTNGLDEDLDVGAGGHSNEIDGDDEKSSGSGSASTKPQKMSLRRALLVYLLPLVMAWFGGIFADLL